LIFEVKETSFAYTAGFGKNQSQKIFKKSETHIQKGLLELNDSKIPVIFAGYINTYLKVNEFNRRIQRLQKSNERKNHVG
jgi:ribosomal protein S13